MKKRFLYTIILVACATSAAAQGSALGSGRWWKLTVEQEGLYRLTTADVPGLAGASVDSIGIYGAGGSMLSLENSLVPTDGLQPLAIEVVDADGDGVFGSGDAVLFYGEGAGGWYYSNGDARWEYSQHSYATANYYFLTTGCHRHRRIAPAAAVDAAMTVTSYTSVAHIDNELVNIFQTGQKWMGERFNTSLPSRTFSLQTSGNSDGTVKVRYALANHSSATSQFVVSTSGYTNHIGISSRQVYSTVTDAFATTASSFTFTVAFSAGESAATGYLDFIELNSHAPLTFRGGQLIVRNDQHLESTTGFLLTGQTNGVSVWEVTRAGQERKMQMASGRWSDSATTARKYIVFDGSSYLTPSAIAAQENQDLHGCPAAELVVVSHPALLSEAQRVATLHEIFDGISTLTVTDQQVYNEYSSGKQDPMALRTLLRDLKARHPSAAPRWLLLMGSGTFDARHLLGGHDVPSVVTYETPYSFDEDGISYCSDDIMGYLSPTGRGSTNETMEVSVGRLPAKSLAEARHMVDKIEGYLTRRDLLADGERGDWRNYVALLADDADPGHPGDSAFAHSSEVVARNIGSLYPQLNIDKLYADAYHQSSGAIGSYYPDLNNALRQRMNKGCLLLNYIGHGSNSYIGTERYIELSDVEAYSNTDRLPLFVTSTCSYGRFDRPDVVSGAEAFLLAPAAAVAVISASRPISHVERFNNDVVCFSLDPHNTIGDALRMAKNRTSVAQCIGLTGDPALRLSRPENRVVVTHINNRAVSEGIDDTATVLSRVTVTGEVQDTAGMLLSDFDGTLYPIVFDRTMRSRTLANDNPGTEVSFEQQKNILFRGSVAVSGGRFEYSVIVPQDVAYQYGYAKLSHYAKSASDHAAGCYSQLLLGGLNDTATLSTLAPTIRLFIGDTHFLEGGIVDSDPTLVALLYDSAGINAGSGLGHDITAILDGNPSSLVVLNDLYEPDVDHDGCGSVSYQFTSLTPGRHTLTLKAWNIFNRSSEATVSFTVCNRDTLTLSELRCFPNPAKERTQFLLEVNNTSKVASAEMQIYDSHGKCILTHTPAVSSDGYVVGPVMWEVSEVPPGLYLARFIVIDTEGHTYQQATKCIVR